jgi:cytochrome c oxidase cbb3-type subunit 3
MLRLACVGVFLLATAAASPAAAQEPGDLQQGKQLFEGLCGRCHGIDGTGDEGPSLARPTLTRAPDDKALREIIAEGIPDRGMPRVRRLIGDEVDQLVAYVRSLGRVAATAPVGNAQKGVALYQRLGCAACHIVNGAGTGFGPELTDIGVHRSPNYLRKALLEPGATLPKGVLEVPARGFDEFLPVHIVARDGRDVRGVRINEDSFTIQVKDQKNQFHSFRKDELQQLEKEFGKSFMPGYRDRLPQADLDDLVAYLSALGGAK